MYRLFPVERISNVGNFLISEQKYKVCVLNILNKIILNSLIKRDKMLGKPRFLYLFPNSFDKFK